MGIEYKPRKLRDLTEKVLTVLFPEIPTDYVAFRSFFVVGTMESGKTSLLRYLAKRAFEKYGDAINIVGSNKFKVLIKKIDNKPVQLLFMDDAYRHGKKLSTEEIADLFEIRHLYEDKGNMRGLLIVGAVIQDFFRVDKPLRNNINVFFIKSFPSTGHDKNVYKKEFTPEGYRFLKKVTRNIFLKVDNTAKSYSLVKFNFADTPGIFFNQFIPQSEDPINWVLDKIEEKEVKQEEIQKEMEAEGYMIKLQKKIEDPDFFKQLIKVYPKTYSRLEKMYNGRPFKKFKMIHLTSWYNYYSTGTSADRIAEAVGVSKSALLNKYELGGWFSIVDREILGHLAEDALIATYFQGYKIIAGESEPDLMSEDEKTIVEVKVRRRFEGPNINMLNKKELNMLEEDWKLLLAVITYAPRKCIIRIYSIEKKNQTGQ